MICGSLKDTNSECPSTSEHSITAIQETASVLDAEDTVGDMSNFSDLYLRNVCMFYIKLQASKIPASTIQNTVEEIQNVLYMSGADMYFE